MPKLHVVVPVQHTSSDVEGHSAGVYADQPTYTWCEEPGPPTGAAAGIEADRIRWKVVPWKDRRIRIEHLGELTLVQGLVAESRPLVTKCLDDAVIDVSLVLGSVAHGLLIVDSGGTTDTLSP